MRAILAEHRRPVRRRRCVRAVDVSRASLYRRRRPVVRTTGTRHSTVPGASGLPAHVPLPGVHRVAALAKRWLLGTHQGAVEADHLQAYLNEFCFRFNRRHSRARGLLFYRLMHLAVGAPPLYLPASRGEPPAQAASPITKLKGPIPYLYQGPWPSHLRAGPGARLQHWSEPGAVRWIPRYQNLLTSKWVEVSEPAQLARCLQPICHRVTTID